MLQPWPATGYEQSNCGEWSGAGATAPSHLAPEHASDPLFLGYALADFQAHTGLGQRGLAGHLGCVPANLPHLALRRCPQPGSPSYHADLQQLRELFGTDPNKLDRLLQTLAELHQHERGPPESKPAPPRAGYQ